MVVSNRKAAAKRLRILAFVLIAAILGLIGTQVVYAIGNKKDTSIVRVGVYTDTYNDIWDAVNKQLKDNGDNVQIQLVKLAGEQINRSLAAGEIDLNAAPHYAYFNWQTKTEHIKGLEPFAETIIQPLNLYSDKIKDVDQFKDGDSIVIPSDPTNGGRALKVLERAGLIKVDPDSGYLPTVNDVTDNPKNLRFKQVVPYNIPNMLPEATAGVINADVAKSAGIDPGSDAIYSVPVNTNDIYNKPWINLIAGRAEDRDNPAIRKVLAAYDSDTVRKVFDQNHKGEAVLVFKDLVS